MFGYIKPKKSELLVREFGEYGGVYCTLCRKLGRDYGPAARLALNYDCTFYAILLMAVSGGADPKFHRGRCVVNPLKKCDFCEDDRSELSSAAALTIILAYYKLRDNLADSGFFRGLPFRLAYPFLAFRHRCAAKKYPELERIAAEAMKAQAKVEKTENPSVDFCAEPTARMLAQILENAAAGEKEVRVLHEFGYYLGRWVYLMDAADDITKDLKRKSFNPFVEKFRLNRESPREALDGARDYANGALNGTLVRLGATANLLECSRFGSIVHNIVFLGLPQIQKERLFAKENGNV